MYLTMFRYYPNGLRTRIPSRNLSKGKEKSRSFKGVPQPSGLDQGRSAHYESRDQRRGYARLASDGDPIINYRQKRKMNCFEEFFDGYAQHSIEHTARDLNG